MTHLLSKSRFLTGLSATYDPAVRAAQDQLAENKKQVALLKQIRDLLPSGLSVTGTPIFG